MIKITFTQKEINILTELMVKYQKDIGLELTEIFWNLHRKLVKGGVEHDQND